MEIPEQPKDFQPELVLTQQQVADLAGIIFHPGFAVFQLIGKSAVDQFVTNCLNQEDEDEILSAHKSAKVAAQLYTMWLTRMKNEVHDYSNTIKDKDKIEDPTANLDMGGMTALNIEEESIL